jgi:hypothetical protein
MISFLKTDAQSFHPAMSDSRQPRAYRVLEDGVEIGIVCSEKRGVLAHAPERCPHRNAWILAVLGGAPARRYYERPPLHARQCRRVASDVGEWPFDAVAHYD